MLRIEPSMVLLDQDVIREFLDRAVGLYRRLTPETPYPCFAVLLGTLDNGAAHIQRLEFGRNARASDPAAVDEFQNSIIPRFGAAYENPERGYWLDPDDLLLIHRLAEAHGLDILGSIHMHPDWHRIGPPPAHRTPLSERPTGMDEHVFRGTGWPVNLICYLEDVGGNLYYTLQAWSSPTSVDSTSQVVPTRICAPADMSGASAA